MWPWQQAQGRMCLYTCWRTHSVLNILASSRQSSGGDPCAPVPLNPSFPFTEGGKFPSFTSCLSRERTLCSDNTAPTYGLDQSLLSQLRCSFRQNHSNDTKRSFCGTTGSFYWREQVITDKYTNRPNLFFSFSKGVRCLGFKCTSTGFDHCNSLFFCYTCASSTAEFLDALGRSRDDVIIMSSPIEKFLSDSSELCPSDSFFLESSPNPSCEVSGVRQPNQSGPIHEHGSFLISFASCIEWPRCTSLQNNCDYRTFGPFSQSMHL